MAASLSPQEQAAPASGSERPDSLWAWSPLDSVFAMPPSLTVGERVACFEEDERACLAMSVIIPARHARRSAGLVDMLQELPGLEMRRYGGLGAFSTASLRGSGGQEVAVYLDGVDLRSPFTGLALLDELPLTGVSRVEVYRGGAPTELGGGVAAGAIQVITERGEVRGLKLGYGGFDTRVASAELSGSGPWLTRWRLDAAMQSSASDYEYLDRLGTLNNNSADDSIRVRNNADSESRDLLAMLDWTPPAGFRSGRLSLFYRYVFRENGIPGSASLPTYHTRSRRSGHDARIDWRGPLILQSLRLRAKGYLRDGRNRFLNPETETGPFLVADETSDRLRSLGWQVHADVYLPPLHLLLRGERREDNFTPDNLNPLKTDDFDFERSRRARRIEGEARLLLWRDRLLLQAAYGEEWLHDNYHFFEEPSLPWLPVTSWAPHSTHGVFRSAGMKLRLLERAGESGALSVDLRAFAADGYRPPTLLELFGQDVSVSGDPALLPELSKQHDTGLMLHWTRWRLELDCNYSRYRRDITQQIVFLRNSQFSVRAANLTASELSGVELGLRLAWRWTRNRKFRLSLADTRQDTRDRGPDPAYAGKRLPYRSPRSFFARLGCDLGACSFFCDADWRSRVHPDRYNDPERVLPERTLWGAGGIWRVGRGLSMSLDVLNLGDRLTEDILGYPLPGRTWRLGCEWSSRTEDPESGKTGSRRTEERTEKQTR